MREETDIAIGLLLYEWVKQAEAEVSRSLISAIEAPGLAYNFTLDVLYNIADALGVEAKDLLGGEWPAVLVK